MNRRQFVQTSLLGASVVPKMRAGVAPESDIANTSVAVPGTKLFPTELPELQWREFRAAGFEAPVAGVIYRPVIHRVVAYHWEESARGASTWM